MSRKVSERTKAMCADYLRRLAAGEDERTIIGDLAAKAGVQRPAVWKALRAGGAVPPYQPRKENGRGRPIGGGVPGYTEQRRAKAAEVKAERAAMALPAPAAEPCGRCGVRVDVGCAHQAPAGPPPPAIANPTKIRPRQDYSGQGLNFRAQRRD